MPRLALAIIVVAAGSSAAAVTTHKHAHHTGTVSDQVAPVVSREPELRASRGLRRPLLPGRHRAHRDPVWVHGQQRWQRWLDITAYCATGNHAADGTWPRLGDVATLDRSIPFGTHLDIDGHRFTVVDRIGWGSDIDIYMGAGADCQRRATEWGRRRLLVREVSR